MAFEGLLFKSDPGSSGSSGGFANPMTTGGDIIYGGNLGVPSRLANGSSFQVLTSTGSTNAPLWQTPATNSFFQGFFGFTSIWSTSSTSFADPSNSNGNLLNVRLNSGIGAVAAGNSLCGLFFTPPVTWAVYSITAIFGITNNTAGADTSVRIIDGVSTVLCVSAGFGQQAVTPDVQSTFTLHGFYQGNTTSPVTIKLQACVTSGSGLIQNFSPNNSSGVSVEWSILRIV
jgi:hypothetical protein